MISFEMKYMQVCAQRSYFSFSSSAMGHPKMSKEGKESTSLPGSLPATRATIATDKKLCDSCSRVRVLSSPYFEIKGASEEHHPQVRLSSREKWTPPRSPFNLIQVCLHLVGMHLNRIKIVVDFPLRRICSTTLGSCSSPPYF